MESPSAEEEASALVPPEEVLALPSSAVVPPPLPQATRAKAIARAISKTSSFFMLRFSFFKFSISQSHSDLSLLLWNFCKTYFSLTSAFR